MPVFAPIAASLLLWNEPLPEIRARFCWSEAPPGPRLTVHLFRREFDLAEKPASRRIVVSADSRYVLWLNGERIGRGPLKGTLQHYHAETYELAPLLRVGRNVLAAEVRWFGEDAPTSEVHSHQAGLFVQDLAGTELDTPGEWRVWRDTSIAPNDDDPFVAARGFLGPMDHVTPALRPHDWKEIAFDDSSWSRAIAVGPPPASPGWGVVPLRQLAPREIPALREDPREFSRVIRDRQPSALPWSLGAGEGGEIWLDAGALTTSYPVLQFEDGTGRDVRITYAEGLGRWHDADGSRVWRKSERRDDIATSEPHGYHDRLQLPGGSYTFEPFHWRTFWFVKIVIAPGAEPVSLTAATHRFTTYPQDFTAQFTCTHPNIGVFWENSLRTLQLCAHETYEDCPYYEQLNYVGDTRLQALCSYHLANETRLARRSLRLFLDSLGPDGLTASREPSRNRQVIPAFSLHWILMLGDYWEWNGAADADFVRSCLPGVDAVLAYFRSRIGANGFVGAIDGWAWTDWVFEWPRGVAPAVGAGTGSTFMTALYAHALEVAIRLHREAGIAGDAERWENLRQQLLVTLHDHAWFESAGLFIEGPGRESDPFTQHSQVMAILAGAADARQQQRIRTRLLDDCALTRMSLFGRYYLARALEKAGDYDRLFSDVLAPWDQMVRDGLSTWVERIERPRSDCHAWSSWMVIDFFRSILGARPVAPGWQGVEIRPQFFVTTAARGEFPTPVGSILVEWSRDDAQRVSFHARVPAGVPTRLVLPDGATVSFPAGGTIRREITLAGVAPAGQTPAVSSLPP